VKDEAGATGNLDSAAVTRELGDEGGTPGDVEIGEEVTGTGSEAGETWRPTDRKVHEIVRDEEGEGRRAP